MNGNTIKEFLVSLGFKVDEQSLQKFNLGLNAATLKAVALGGAVAAAAGVVATGALKIAQSLDEVKDVAARVDLTTEAVERLGYIAEFTGSSVQAARNSLESLNKTAGQAANGLGRGKQWFDKLGISVKDANGRLKNTDDLLFEIGRKIRDFDRGQQIAALEGLGIDGSMLEGITSDVSDLREEFDRMYKAAGIDLNESAEAAGEFNDEVGKLGMTLQAFGRGAAAKSFDPLRRIVQNVRSTLIEWMPRIIRMLSFVTDITLRVAGAIGQLTSRALSVIGTVIDWIFKIQDATNGWAGIILAVVAAWKYLNLAFLATPVGRVLAMAAALALLVDDFLTWKEGGESFVDWSQWEKEIAQVSKIVGNFHKLLQNFFNFIFAAIDTLVSLFTGDWSRAWWAAGEALDTFLDSAKQVWDLIKNIGNFPLFGGSDGPTIAPPSATTGGAGNVSQNVTQSTQINVTGNSAEEAARRTLDGQRGVNADLTRNLKTAAR